MKKLFVLAVMTLVAATTYAQDVPDDYFKKLPSRYIRRNVKPAQLFYFGWTQGPPSDWVKNALELRMDVARIRINEYSNIAITPGIFAGLHTQEDDLYSVNGKTAVEKAEYQLVSPALSVAYNYGILFPYVMSFRVGGAYSMEKANYEANIPLQVRDAGAPNGIRTEPLKFAYNKEASGLSPYLSLGIFRPFGISPEKKKKFGLGIAASYFVNNNVKRVSLNYGLYWHP